MPANRTRQHILAYDIADPRRLQRVHRLMKQNGVPLQYSVFILQMSRKELRTLLTELRHLIDENADDIRVYPLPRQHQMVQIGQPYVSDGALLIDLPNAQPWPPNTPT